MNWNWFINILMGMHKHLYDVFGWDSVTELVFLCACMFVQCFGINDATL